MSYNILSKHLQGVGDLLSQIFNLTRIMVGWGHLGWPVKNCLPRIAYKRCLEVWRQCYSTVRETLKNAYMDIMGVGRLTSGSTPQMFLKLQKWLKESLQICDEVVE